MNELEKCRRASALALAKKDETIDKWKRRALEAEEAGRAILEWEGSNCDGYADKVSGDCPFCKMRAVLNSINS